MFYILRRNSCRETKQTHPHNGCKQKKVVTDLNQYKAILVGPLTSHFSSKQIKKITPVKTTLANIRIEIKPDTETLISRPSLKN